MDIVIMVIVYIEVFFTKINNFKHTHPPTHTNTFKSRCLFPFFHIILYHKIGDQLSCCWHSGKNKCCIGWLSFILSPSFNIVKFTWWLQMSNVYGACNVRVILKFVCIQFNNKNDIEINENSDLFSLSL